MAPPIHRSSAVLPATLRKSGPRRARVLAAEHFRGAGTPRPGPVCRRPGADSARPRTVGVRCRPCRRCSGRCRVTSSTRCRWRRGRPRRSRPGCGEVIGRAASAGRRPPSPPYTTDRRGTAATLRAIDAGARRWLLRRARASPSLELDAADARVRRSRAGHRRADPPRRSDPLGRARARPRSTAFLRMADPDRWPGEVDPACDRRRARGRRSCSARRRPRSRCSRPRPVRPRSNVLTNAQIAAARDVIDRYAGTGRVLTHTIVHPNFGAARARRDGRVARASRSVGLEGLHALRSADEGVADRRLVPRRRRDRHAVPRARERARATRRRRAQGPRRTDPRPVGRRGIAA